MPARHPLRLPAAAIAVLTLAVAVIVAVGGGAGWRVIRVGMVSFAGGLALASERRSWRATSEVAELICGVGGVTIGAGIGIMHLAKSDVGLTAIAGLAALAAGLYLLGRAALALWRATPGWWRLAAIPAAFTAFQFVLLPVTTAIYGTNLPATSVGPTTPASRGLAYRDVDLTTSDHVRLAAWYIPSTNGAAVVLAHGSGSTRASVLDQAGVLARHGYGVLLVDARGHGQSGGVGMDFGWWGNRDLDAAVSWLASRPEITGGRIGVVGMSMGGEEAIGAAAGDSRIRAVVTEGALWRGSMDTAWLRRTLQGYIDRATLSVQTAVANLLTSAPEPISLRRAVAAMSPRPLLLIAGKPELRGDRYLRDASPDTVQLWELPDTPHVSALRYHPAEWEARVVGFLDRSLLAHRES